MIFPAGKRVKFRILARGAHAVFDDSGEDVVGPLPLDETNESLERTYDTMLVRTENGALHARTVCRGERRA